MVEDDEDIAGLILFQLNQAGFHAKHLAFGRTLLSTVRQYRPQLILLDLMLPDIDGIDLCKRLKQDIEFADIPLLIVTARGSESDRIVGLELGADDYIVKPFSPRELVLRVKAVLSRVYPNHPTRTQPVLEQGVIMLDPQRHRVEVNHTPVELTATEFKLLKELMYHAGRVRTREILLERVWGYSFDGYARTVDTHIRRLRKKLGDQASLIETVRGVGYRFRAEE